MRKFGNFADLIESWKVEYNYRKQYTYDKLKEIKKINYIKKEYLNYR